MLKRILLALAVAMATACVRMPPQATAPKVCDGCSWWPSNAWLTVEKDQHLVGWVEVDAFQDDTLDIRYSRDDVPIVVGMRQPLFDTIYEHYRELFAAHDMRLSKHRFRKAIRGGQLTCHFGAISWPAGEYAMPSGTTCVNNLLLSLPRPADPDYLLASLNIILEIHDDRDEVAPGDPPAAGEEESSQRGPKSSGAGSVAPATQTVRSRVPASGPDGVVRHARASAGFVPRSPTLDASRIAPLETILSIIEAATKFEDVVRDGDTVSFARDTCIRNLPSEMVAKDPELTEAVVTAFVQYGNSTEGKARFTKHAIHDDPAELWGDPCLAGELEPFLNAQKVYVLPNAEFKALKARCMKEPEEGVLSMSRGGSNDDEP